MRRRLREVPLFVFVALLAVASLAVFTWAEWHFYVLNEASHHAHAVFWSRGHLYDWLYNAAANWQSELIFGVVLVWWLHKRGAEA